MTNLHAFWISCLHCPIFFIVGVGIVIVAFCGFLVSALALSCKDRSNASQKPSETMRSTFGCESDVPHVVF